MNHRSLRSELLRLLGRFVLFLAFLKLTYPTGLELLLRVAAPRLTARPRSMEIVQPLDGFTGPARLVAPSSLRRPTEGEAGPLGGANSDFGDRPPRTSTEAP